MKLLTCSRCNSQFDVSSMTSGTSFVCGKCRNVLEVPAAGPVVMPIGSGPSKGGVAPPPTVSMSPEQVQKALRASQEVGKQRKPRRRPAQPAKRAPAPKPAPLDKRMQQPATMALSPDEVRKALQASKSVHQQKAGAQRPAAQRPAAKGKAKPQLPKAMQQRAQQKQTTRPGAAAAAQPAAAAAKKGGRAARGGGRAARGGGRPAAGAKKSPVPLIAGAAVAALLLGGGGWLLFGGGGGDGAPENGGTPPGAESGTENGGTPGTVGTSGTELAAGTSGVPGPSGVGTGPAVALDAVGKLLALSAGDQQDDLLGRLRSARGDMKALESLHRFLSDERLAGNAAVDTTLTKVAKEAIKIEDGTAWAREALGHADGLALLKKCEADCGRAFQFADKDEDALKSRRKELEDGEPWVDAAEYKKLEALVEKIRKRNEDLSGDERLVQVEKARDWIRKNELFKGLNVATRYQDPYVVFQEYPTFTGSMEHYNKDREAKANEFARREAHIFSALHGRYRELFADRYGFGTLRENNRLMRVLILWNRDTFNEWHSRQKSGISGFVRAYYSPTERQIVHYLGEDTLKEQNYVKAEGGRIQPGADQVTFHEGTHQLQHEYGAILRGKPLSDETPVPSRKSMWFDEGMAEFFGAVEIDEANLRDMGNATFYHSRILLERTNQGRRHRRGTDTVWWSIHDMIQPNHNGELITKGGELLPSNPTWMANIFYGQAWAFVHFSYFYDNGKYRENLLKYQEKVFKLEHGPEALAECYGRPSPEDWGEIEQEYMWYWRQCLKKPAGRMRVDGVPTGKWYIPNTDPPEGKYEPDDEGGGDYDE